MHEMIFEEQKNSHPVHHEVRNSENSENGDIGDENTMQVAQNANEAQSTTQSE